MIDNPYTNTINSIKASEAFKLRLIEKSQSRAVVSYFTLKKKKNYLKRIRRLTVASILVIAIGAYVIFLSQNHIANNTASNITVNNTAPVGALGPRFKVKDRFYWPQSVSISKLPPSYKLIGKISSYGSDNDYNFENFQSVIVSIGTKVYMDPTNPYAAYVPNIATYDKGNKICVKHIFELYVTNEIRFGSIYYNGGLYNDYVNTYDYFRYLKYVGTVKSVDCTKFPYHNFETDIRDTLGCKVYEFKYDKSLIFIKEKDGDLHCFKLNFH